MLGGLKVVSLPLPTHESLHAALADFVHLNECFVRCTAHTVSHNLVQ